MVQTLIAGSGGFDAEALGNTALTAFFTIAAGWGLSAEEERTLLGSPPRSTFFKWKSEKNVRLSPDTLERISYVMGIYKALQDFAAHRSRRERVGEEAERRTRFQRQIRA